jgi:cytochrome oxidase Cu insertion factor (SCO1/SenC/PrrC family)
MRRILASPGLALLLFAGCGKSAEPAAGTPAVAESAAAAESPAAAAESPAAAAESPAAAAESPAAAAEPPAREQAPPASKLLAVGTPAPAFSSEAHDGTVVSPAAMRGHPWVLYFYPKDDTPG